MGLVEYFIFWYCRNGACLFANVSGAIMRSGKFRRSVDECSADKRGYPFVFHSQGRAIIDSFGGHVISDGGNLHNSKGHNKRG